jgi:outer membrane protein TolC
MARIRLLETEMRNVEESITSEVITLETEAAAALERVRLANRKLDLARKAQQAVEARYQAGLTDAAAVANAESAVLAAQWTQARTVNARKASLFMLYAVSGVDGGAPAEGRPGELSVSAQTQTQTQTQKGLP